MPNGVTSIAVARNFSGVHSFFPFSKVYKEWLITYLDKLTKLQFLTMVFWSWVCICTSAPK